MKELALHIFVIVFSELNFLDFNSNGMDVMQISGQAFDKTYNSTFPSTSKAKGNSTDSSNDCFTVWEPLQLRQEWTVSFLKLF